MSVTELLAEISNIGNMNRFDLDAHKTSYNGNLVRLQVEMTDFKYKITVIALRRMSDISYHCLYYQIELKENAFWSLDRIKFYRNTPVTYFLSMIEDEFEKNAYG